MYNLQQLFNQLSFLNSYSLQAQYQSTLNKIKFSETRLSMKYLLLFHSSDVNKSKSAPSTIRILEPGEYNSQDPFLVLNNPSIRIICSQCLKNITFICHIAVENQDYCPGCFSNLEQFPETYQVRSSLLFSITETQWLCLDEVLFLTAFQKWGFGNWGQVKDFMNFNGCKFSKDEIEKHYQSFFLHGSSEDPIFSDYVVHETRLYSGKDAKRFKGCSQRKEQYTGGILQLKSEDSVPVAKKGQEHKQNILGFNHKRNCFFYDMEYDDKAQNMIAQIQFKQDDTQEEMQLKFQILESYNKRVDQRLKRYDFTIDHHTLDIDYRFKKQFSANKYQKEAFMLYRPFTRFQSFNQNQETMDLIANNNYYKSLIQGLKKCRKKIDKEGRLQETLQYVKSKQNDLERLGQPRKIYHITLQEAECTESELIKKFEEKIRKDQQGQPIVSLKLIYQKEK